MSLGAISYILRKSRGLSLSDVEQITKVNKGALSKFERGKEGLGPEKFDRLCVLYGTSPSVLYALTQLCNKRPYMLEQPEQLVQVVRRLTRLIHHYLDADESTQQQVDKLLSSNHV